MKSNVGIYKIVNIVNDKIYVGSSSNLRSRKYVHFSKLKNNIHDNKHLQNSFNKHKEENFKWEVIEYIEKIDDKKILKNNLLEREQYWMDVLKVCDTNKGYNLRVIAESNLGMKYSEEFKEKCRQRNLGKKHTKEHKLKIKENNAKYWTGKKRPYMAEIMRKRQIGKKHTKEHVENSKVARYKSIINLTTNEVFESIKQAGEFYNINRGHISSVCKGSRKTAGSYRWAYYNS